jgi:hypothetical protein
METVLKLFMQRVFSQRQAERAMAFILAPETFRFRKWEEALLRAILIDGTGIEAAERKFKLPSRSAKAIMARLLESAFEDVRNCAPVGGVDEWLAKDYLDLLRREAANDFLKLVAALGLSPLQAKFLAALLASRLNPTPKEILLSALYGGRNHDDRPDGRILDSVSCNLRKKLVGSRYEVKTTPGGYMLADHGQEAHTAPQGNNWTEADLNRLCGLDPVQILTLATEFRLAPIEARTLAVLKNAMTTPTPVGYVIAALSFRERDTIYSEETMHVFLWKTGQKLKAFGGGISRCSGGGVILDWPDEAWE